MDNDTPSGNRATASTTPDATENMTPGIIMNTGFTGRPRRGQYSKAQMLLDIVSLTDPRLWPIYVGGALIVAIPAFALMKSIALIPSTTLVAKADESSSTVWLTAEDTMTMTEPRVASPFDPAAPQLASTGAKQKQRVAIFGKTNETASAAQRVSAPPAIAQK